LARWQADWVAARLDEHGIAVELQLITTHGDTTSQPIEAVGGQGLFTKEIQRALLDGRIDVAVHSLKDLPTESVEGLALSAIPPRESHRDALVSRDAVKLVELPPNARIGTGSRRRLTQLLHLRPDLQIDSIRGNVDTRLAKLDRGEYDAIMLAEAGLNRLGLADRITEVLSEQQMLPAVGQGALGIECRTSDAPTRGAVAILNDLATQVSVLAERSMLAELRGGCLAPVAAWGRIVQGRLALDGAVLSADGQQRLWASKSATLDRAGGLGIAVAEALLDQGAEGLIAASRE
jgi:hydroxymethylbilane synthase